MKKFLLIFICAVLLVPTSVSADMPDAAVSARSAVLYEPQGGRWVYEKNADVRMPMASTTKIMTALIALRLLPLDAVYTVPGEACGIEGSSLYLKAGDRISVRDLLYGLLLRSANDAAAALAILASGSESAFAEEMNAEAQRLGLENTSFKNPHGLDCDGHYSTARELAMILDAAMQDERFCEISGCEKYTVKLDGRAQVLYNHNKLLHLTDYVFCGKTGFTKKSGRCLVTAAERDGVRLIAVTMSAPDDWNDHMALFGMGFERFEMRTVISEADRFYADVAGGVRDKVLCRPTEELSIVTEKNSTVICDTLLPSLLLAPVCDGEIVGMLRVSENGKVISEICLAACEEIEYKEQRMPLFKRLFKAVSG
ncbi:MAG: D-alanyl-D-alanine carboxypeptidase [Clostridia bacterium]|nr:D-alanyl-D-alanine carboxypeptidase [Clostridia bacterium]